MKHARVVSLLAALLVPFAVASQTLTLKGRVVLASAPPLAAPVRSNKAACGVALRDETLLVGKKLELENAVVFLANIKPERLPATAVAMDIVNCLYQPRVSALLQGDTLVLRNADAANHHARAYLHEFLPGWDRRVTKELFRTDSTEVFNLIMRAKNNTAWQVLDQPGVLVVRSETGEDWLQSYVLIMPHRYFAVTNAAGEFAFANLPPGKYDFVVWHERLGLKRQLVEVSAATKSELVITWQAAAFAHADSLAPAQTQK